MGQPGAQPTVRLTDWRTVLAAALIGAGTGWLVIFLPERLGGSVPALPLVVTVAIGLLAVTVWVMARLFHRSVQVRREPVEATRAVAALAFAKACLLGGAALVGCYLVIGAFSVGHWSAALPRERAISSALAVVASLALASGGRILERACRIPGPPPGDATPGPLPGSPTSPH